MNNRPARRILILMSNTGDGHRASADALQSGFARRFPGCFHVDVIDVAEYLPWPLSRLPAGYGPLTNRLPSVWRALWNASASRQAVEVLARPAAWYVRDAMTRLIDLFAPDIIISVHPMLQHITLDALAHSAPNIRFFTVVTDLVSAHPAWFHPEIDLCFVASNEAHLRARRGGIPAGRIREFGLPVRPKFIEQIADRANLRRELGMHPTLPAVLITGGGEGFGPVADIAAHLAEALSTGQGPRGQLAIICGRNRTLQRQLAACRWPLPVQVAGYVQNMDLWMLASDWMVTKAGPGAIAEALVCGLPMVLSGAIPGQEEGNINFVVENGVGIYEPQPARIADTVRRWLDPHCMETQQMRANAAKLARPDATCHIVEAIAGYLNSPTPSPAPLASTPPTPGRPSHSDRNWA